MEDLNVLIDGKRFFDVPIKNKEEAYEEILKQVKIMILLLKTYQTQLVTFWTMNTLNT